MPAPAPEEADPAGPPAPTHHAAPRPDPGAQFLWRTYRDARHGHLDYLLFVPAGAGDSPLPLLVMLHGCAQGPRDFAIATRMNELAQEQGCCVAYPAQSDRVNRMRCWNWFDPANQQRDAGEPALIAGITRQVMRSQPIDPRRVYVAGLSAGASMAAVMAHTYPDLYAAVGVHSGLAYRRAQDVYSAMMAMRHGARLDLDGARRLQQSQRELPPVPAIVFHGDMDRTVHPDNGNEVVAAIANQAAPSSEMWIKLRDGQVEEGHAYTQAVYIDQGGRVMAEQWVVHGAGHDWSGGDPAGSFADPRGPDASREMLRFFLAHRRPVWRQSQAFVEPMSRPVA
ncbi:extracellular catalytic domain type 1 short-chain-length polyhydroxyalkanoate depolymerase [Noviherbaspirillum humi]|uniref:extracellular catalytic domain type 1 short-chain-length polyhydroxyalkanoate depolymerase n=1 Tax=Noviherbaspirillum humi TaxID=1688639 RepID=UPI0015962054|nr:PHB depolymerase family esterase [Noviherbaspirillum humi]